MTLEDENQIDQEQNERVPLAVLNSDLESTVLSIESNLNLLQDLKGKRKEESMYHMSGELQWLDHLLDLIEDEVERRTGWRRQREETTSLSESEYDDIPF